MKYKTVDELVAAYQNGDLTAKNPLVIDNDHCFVNKNGEWVFEYYPDDLLTDLLTYLGIPCEGA